MVLPGTASRAAAFAVDKLVPVGTSSPARAAVAVSFRGAGVVVYPKWQVDAGDDADRNWDLFLVCLARGYVMGSW